MINFKLYINDLIEKPKNEAIMIVVPIRDICNCNCHSNKPPYKKDLHYDGIEKKDKPCKCGISKYNIKKGQTIKLENEKSFWYAGIPAQKITKINIKVLTINIKKIPDFTEEEIKGITMVSMDSAMEGVVGAEMLNAPEGCRYRQGLTLYASLVLGIKDDNRLAVIEVV